MLGTSRVLAVALLAAVALPAARAAGAAHAPIARHAAPAVSVALTDDARELVHDVLKSRDHAGRPFAVVDKKQARIWVYDGSGRLRGASPVLLGQARGDDIAPDVGLHAQEGEVPFAERTTPAGRFAAEPGVNASGEPIIWVDYNSAFAIHRVRGGRALKPRLERLGSGDPADSRVSYGCVVVPVRFYEDVVQRWLGQGRSTVYVLPEQAPAREIFDAL